MTNEEKLRETFPKTIFIFRKNGNDETAAIMVSDEGLNSEYAEPAAEMLEQEPKTDTLDKIRAEIEPKCDRINSLASVLPYAAHREIQELLCEIMDLCKAESEKSE